MTLLLSLKKVIEWPFQNCLRGWRQLLLIMYKSW